MCLVSVVMSVYNEESYLREAIDSILTQTMKDFEFIIINDGCTDDSQKIISSYSDKRIKLIKHESRMGIVSSLNEGIFVAKGKYIARMDGDDSCRNDRLERQLNYMMQHPEIDILGSFISVINEKSEIVKNQYFFTEHDAILTFSTRGRIDLQHPTIFVKADIMKKNPYDNSYDTAEDYELFSRLVEQYRSANIDETLLLYRMHAKSTSSVKRNIQRETAVRVIKDIISRRGLDKRIEIGMSNDWHNICFLLNYYERLQGNDIVLYASDNKLEGADIVLRNIKDCKVIDICKKEDELFKWVSKINKENRSAIVLATDEWYLIMKKLMLKKVQAEKIIYGFMLYKE